MKDFTIKVAPEQKNLTNAIEFIENKLNVCKTSGKDKAKAILLAANV